MWQATNSRRGIVRPFFASRLFEAINRELRELWDQRVPPEVPLVGVPSQQKRINHTVLAQNGFIKVVLHLSYLFFVYKIAIIYRQQSAELP